jgi:hypothetical protein
VDKSIQIVMQNISCMTLLLLLVGSYSFECMGRIFTLEKVTSADKITQYCLCREKHSQQEGPAQAHSSREI